MSRNTHSSVAKWGRHPVEVLRSTGKPMTSAEITRACYQSMDADSNPGYRSSVLRTLRISEGTCYAIQDGVAKWGLQEWRASPAVQTP